MTDAEITQRMLAIAAEIDRLALALDEHPDEIRRQHGRSLTQASSTMRTWAVYVPPVARENAELSGPKQHSC